MKKHTYKKYGVTHTIGVYMVKHRPTGRSYIGGTEYSIEGRFSHHKASLRAGRHSCHLLQMKWNATKPSEWVFLILETCPRNRVKMRETYWIRHTKKLFNIWPGPLDKHTHTEATKRKMSASAVRVASDPAERKRRSERAKKQHRQKNFGWHTRKRA